MNSFDAVFSIMGVISFLLFLIFYKRLKKSPFWGKVHPRGFWAMLHLIAPGSRIGTMIVALYEGRHVEILSAMMHITVFTVTGIIMMRLANRAEIVSLNGKLSEDIDKDVRKLSSK